MSRINYIAILAIVCTAVALLVMAVPASAEAGYHEVYRGYVSNDVTTPAGGYTIKATFSNNSSDVHITFRMMGYGDVTATTTPNNYLDFNNVRVEVISIDNAGDRVYLIIKVLDSGTSTPSGVELTCNILGQRALGGDRVTFPITIQNNDAEGHTYTLTASSDTGWELSFTSAGKDVYKLFVPGQQSATVDLVVQTTAGTGIGEKRVTAKADNSAIDLFVYITSVNQSAAVTYDVSSKIAAIGDKITYSLKIKNLQSKENIYRLSASGLPENWYYRYKSDPSSPEELAEVVIPAGGERSLVLEIVPPYSVSPGDFSFVSTVITPDETLISKDLTLRLKSSVGMEMISSRQGYDAKPGETFEIDVYVRNTGNGAALTNVYLETQAPDGWAVQVTPNRTNSIPAGSAQTFKVKVTPPGNIVASEYDIDITAKSDQAEAARSYRISVTVDSIVPYIGGAIILFVIVGLVLVYRKYGRR